MPETGKCPVQPVKCGIAFLSENRFCAIELTLTHSIRNWPCAETPQPSWNRSSYAPFPGEGDGGRKTWRSVRQLSAGLVGDRVYAYFDPENKTDFPWMTPRIWHGDASAETKICGAARRGCGIALRRKNYRVEMTTPEGSVFDVSAAPHLLELLGTTIWTAGVLRFSERSMHDARPVSIFGIKLWKRFPRRQVSHLMRRDSA